MDKIIALCKEPDEENVSDLRDRVDSLEQEVNSQKQTIDLLLERVDKLAHQLDTRAASTAAVTTVANTVTTAAVTTVANTVTTVANTSTATTCNTTSTTTTFAPEQQRASYPYSYRSWCRQACLVAGLDARPIPGCDVLLKPIKAYKCYHSDCKTMASPINVYINHLKVVHDVQIRDQTMISLERMRYLPISK